MYSSPRFFSPNYFVPPYFLGGILAPAGPVYPPPADVRLGIVYGPNGTDYEGTWNGITVNNYFANATVFDVPPVASNGRLRAIIIGDDYLAANSRSFTWTVPAVTGFTPASVVVKFGATGVFACGQYSFLVTRTGVTDNGNGTWTVSIDLPGSATASLVPGDYDWSMTLSSGSVNITKIQNLTSVDRVKVLASPS